MNDEDFNIRAKVISETFDDRRQIVKSVDAKELGISSDVHQGGDIFMTSNGEFIDLEFQMVDFTPEELAKYIELAEELYKKHEKQISIYILCPNSINICVREFEIFSKASFTIKLACINENPCEIILNGIKRKMATREGIDIEDLKTLAELHDICDKEDSRYFLTEYLKIANRLHY